MCPSPPHRLYCIATTRHARPQTPPEPLTETRRGGLAGSGGLGASARYFRFSSRGGERLNRIVTISIGIYFVRRLVVRVGFKLVVPIRGSVHHKRSQHASFSIKAVHTAYEAYSLRRACGLHSTHVRVKQAQAGTISLGLSSSSPAVEEGICVESRHAMPAREVHGEYGG